MKTLGVLDLTPNTPLTRLQRFTRTFNALGWKVEPWDGPAVEPYPAFLYRCDALMIPTWTIINDPQGSHLTRAAILAGKRALVYVDVNERDRMNAFLDPFSVEVTGLRPTTHGLARPAEMVQLHRRHHRAAFRDEGLFGMVEHLAEPNPYHIRISGDARVLLALPNAEGMLLDVSTDYFRPTNPDTVNVMVQGATATGEVGMIATSSLLWTDVGFGGVESVAEVNEQLIRNLSSWLGKSF